MPCPLPAAEINTAFELLHSGKCLRCVLSFGGGGGGGGSA